MQHIQVHLQMLHLLPIVNVTLCWPTQQLFSSLARFITFLFLALILVENSVFCLQLQHGLLLTTDPKHRSHSHQDLMMFQKMQMSGVNHLPGMMQLPHNFHSQNGFMFRGFPPNFGPGGRFPPVRFPPGFVEKSPFHPPHPPPPGFPMMGGDPNISMR